MQHSHYLATFTFSDLYSHVYYHVNYTPFIEGDLGAPVVEGAGDEDLLASPGPADDGGPGLRSRLHQVVQVRGRELFLPGHLWGARKAETQSHHIHFMGKSVHSSVTQGTFTMVVKSEQGKGDI